MLCVRKASGLFGDSSLVLQRPSTSPCASTSNLNQNNQNMTKNPQSVDSGASDAADGSNRMRSLSLRDADPASLLLGDYMIAPLHNWAVKMQQQSAATAGNSNGNNAEYGNGSEDFDSNCGNLWPTNAPLWGPFSSCTSQQRRRSNDPSVTGTR